MHLHLQVVISSLLYGSWGGVHEKLPRVKCLCDKVQITHVTVNTRQHRVQLANPSKNPQLPYLEPKVTLSII